MRVGAGGAVSLLLRFDLHRAVARVRRPAAGPWLGVAVPALLVGGALAAAGGAARPPVEQPAGASLLAFLVAAPVSFFAYGLLFRPADQEVVTGLGLPGSGLAAHRAVRLLGAGLAVVGLLLLPFLGAPGGIRPALAPALAALVVAWGAALWATVAAGAATLRGGGRMLRANLDWDPELARAAPLLYAPLVPLLLGIAAGIWVGWPAPGSALRLGVAGMGAGGFALAAVVRFARIHPAFPARAREMAMGHGPVEGAAGLTVGRGLARVLPRRAAAVCARDAAVSERRFPWARRIAWPLGLGAVVAIGRWGHHPEVRAWVAGAVLVGFLVQATAGLALGRSERAGRRWIDRSLGVGLAHRLLGRWAWGLGTALWLAVPVAIVWAIWTPAGGGWIWLLGAAAVSGGGAILSVGVAGR